MSTAPVLPSFPWDSLAEHKATAAAHPGGIVDLSVGTPVDDVPEPVRAALTAGANAPGYPTVHGTAALRAAAADALARRFGVTVPADAILPTIGSKELVAALPGQLGLRAGDTVAIPELAYPTYEVGARLAGAEVTRGDPRTAPGPPPALLWLNSPSNPTGGVLPADELRALVDWARAHGVTVASDECYLALHWTGEAPLSVLHPDICGGDHTGLLAVHSLSKTSNLAGYRAGFVTGDPALVAALLEVRRHAGFMVPRPIQDAVTAALADDTHLAAQRDRYRARRAALHAALGAAGLRTSHSGAGLYLWATEGTDAWSTVARLAERGILVAPGTFYGPAGHQHVRVALTATDERVEAAAARLR